MNNACMYMRTWIFCSVSVILLFLGIAVEAAVCADTPEKKRVLIINSYGEQIAWSRSVTDSLESKIHKMYPDWMVYSGNLKTESATYIGATILTLRSILWGYAERTLTRIDATNLQSSSIFVQDDVPNALIWIGEEGFLNYISHIAQLGKWKEVPMVLCAVKDSVSSRGWFPGEKFRFDSKYGIRDYSVVTKLLRMNPLDVEKARKDKNIHITKSEGAETYRLDYYLNYSGNVIKQPIRENLELIHRLLPDLQELIWVDDDSYRTTETRLEVEKVLKEVLPDVKYSKMIHNRMNTDSIYDVMLEPAEHRAFLSYSWNIDAMHSKRSDREIDSLFTNVSTVPLFTLTERNFNKDNYWVGGIFLDGSQMVNCTLAMLVRAVRGDSIMALPFDTVSESRVVLNRTALERYGLEQAADKLKGVSYVHIPPTFFHKYERQLLVGTLVLMLVVGYLLIGWRRHKYNKQIQADYARYKRLYDKLQVIYKNSSIDFALYSGDGKRLLRIVNGESTAESGEYDLFCENIFESPHLTDDLKEQIRLDRIINCEISLDHNGRQSRTSFAEHAVYQLIVKPLYEVNYRNSSFMAIAINLTPTLKERREKERFEELFRFASDSSQVGVVFYDVDTAVGKATNSWCRNMNEEFVSGVFPVYGQVVEEDRDFLLKFQQAIRAGDVQDAFCREIQVNGKDDRKHWIRQHMYFIQSSNRLVELSLNIDEQKSNEKRLEKAKQKAEEANEETRCFLNSISHEVRTPLNAIVGFSTILANSNETGEEYIPIILRNTRLLNALIKNILDLSALDAGKITFCYKQFNIEKVFIDMGSYIRNNLDEHSLKVVYEMPECEEERFITTDEEYLRKLLLNLLSNAVKFTNEGSVTFGCRRREYGLYFYVSDTGCGIAPEDQKSIFNRFVKLDAYVQGTGLGLALCKSIVKHLGGKIGVTSEKGKGSTFWFVLPNVQ